MFIKIDGIPGESEDTTHREEIEVTRWEWGLRHFASKKADFSGRISKESNADFKFTHYFDRASPTLAHFCYTGRLIPQTTLTMRRAAGTPHEFARMTLYDAVVTEVGMDTGKYASEEQVTLSFLKLKVEYIGQRRDGGKGVTTTAMLDSQAVQHAQRDRSYR